MYCYQLYICTIQNKNNLGRHHLTSLGDIAEGTTRYFWDVQVSQLLRLGTQKLEPQNVRTFDFIALDVLSKMKRPYIYMCIYKYTYNKNNTHRWDKAFGCEICWFQLSKYQWCQVDVGIHNTLAGEITVVILYVSTNLVSPAPQSKPNELPGTVQTSGSKWQFSWLSHEMLHFFGKVQNQEPKTSWDRCWMTFGLSSLEIFGSDCWVGASLHTFPSLFSV